MARVTAAHLVARTLKKHGITRIFGLCGNEINGLFNACVDEGMLLCDTRHEAAAAHMADGWARFTGTPGVSIVSKGAGHTNSITGISTAFQAGSPMLALSGSASTAAIDRKAPHEIAQADLVERVTKWSRTVMQPARIPEYVNRALWLAMCGTPGPVHLSIPGDVLSTAIEDGAVRIPEPLPMPRPSAPSGAAELVAGMLAQAKRPLVIAGSGVLWGGASEALQRFVDRTLLPCVTVGMARGAISDEHPASLGSGDLRLNEVAAEACRRADCVLVVGESFDFRLSFGRMFAADSRIIQVHADAAELGRNLEPSLGITAHAAEWLEALDRAARDRGGWAETGWLTELRSAARSRKSASEPAASSGAHGSVHPAEVARAVAAAFSAEPFCAVLDMGDFASFCATLPAREPKSLAGPLGTVGSAIPMGIAAKLARPERPVIVCIGDGGFGFHGWELHTALRLRVPIVVVVGNDCGWGMERQLQMAELGRTAGVELGPMRYDKVAEAMGGLGFRVEQSCELRPALEQALSSGQVAVVDVRIDSLPSAITKGLLLRK